MYGGSGDDFPEARGLVEVMFFNDFEMSPTRVVEPHEKRPDCLCDMCERERRKKAIMDGGSSARPGESIEKGGLKYDVGKEPVQQGVFEYFPRALLAVARVSAYGAQKYSWGNWKKQMEDGINRCGNARGRHILKEAIDPNGLDVESKLRHAEHEAWGALARLELILIEQEKTK